MYIQENKDLESNIAIVGGGHAGMCTAIRLMRHARGKMNIYLFEKGGAEKERGGKEEGGIGGIAYAPESADEGHHLNLQAGRISILREDPEHFMRWAQFRGHDVNESSPVSRRQFFEYCWDTLWVEAKKCPYANLLVCEGVATGFVEENGHVDVTFKKPPQLKVSSEELKVTKLQDALPYMATNPLQALLMYECALPPLPAQIKAKKEVVLPEHFDHLVLATGHLEVKKPEALKHLEQNENRVIIDQYISTAYGMMDEAVTNIKSTDTILIMGSGLAALDPVISIVNRCHESGKELPNFVLCSRHSNRHPTYAPDHKHRAFTVSRPDILNQESISLAELEGALPDIWKKATNEIMAQNGDAIAANPRLIDERIMKAMEPYVVELGTKMSAEDVKLAFAKWGSLITASRIGVVPKIGDVIDELESGGKLRFVAGQLMHYADEEATINLKAGGEEKIKPLLLVNSIGRNFDYANTTNELWGNADLDFLPQQKTGMGVELTADSKLLRGSNKQPYERVYVVGVSSIGDEIERNGRTGAFSQSQGPIKSRATFLAWLINQLISRPIPEVGQYFEFAKNDKGSLQDFLATLPEANGGKLSTEFGDALHSLQRAFNLRFGNMVEHLYAESYSKYPVEVLANLERSAKEWLVDISDFANGRKVPRAEQKLLEYAVHILLEDHIAGAMERCRDVTKDPSNIVKSVSR